MTAKTKWISAVAVFVAAAALVWVIRPQGIRVAAIPARCPLLSETTIAQSFEPPSTRADYDRTLAVLERKIDGDGAAAAMFLTEAANRRFQRFQNLRDTTDLEQAEILTERQLERTPGNPAALSRRAALRGARHDFAGALADAKAAGSVLQQIDALDELGRFEEAEALLQDVPQKGLGAFLRHARAADNAGHPDQAASLLDQAIQEARYGSLSFMSLAGLLSQRATLALHNADYEAACASYTEALSLHPGQVSTLEWLGRWAWHAGKEELGFRFVERAGELDPKNAALKSLAAEMAGGLIDPENTEEAGQWALSRDQMQAAAVQLEEQWPDWYRLQTAERLANGGEQELAVAMLEHEESRRKGREWLAAAVAVETTIDDLDAAADALSTLQGAGVLHPPVLYRAWLYYRAAGMEASARKAAKGLVAGRIELTPQEWHTIQEFAPLRTHH